MKRIEFWLLIVPLVFTAGCCRPGLGTTRPYKLSLSELAGNQEKYADKLVQVKGDLGNAGDNYFTDLKVTLSDGQGNSIRVQPWLPISVPPPRPGGPRSRPALLSDYLGKALKLTGKWVKQEGGYILQVDQAGPAE